MISQNKKKLIRALEQKKRRDAEGLFVAEGRKTVGDLLRGGLKCTYLAGTPERLAELEITAATETAEATADEIAEISALKTRSELFAIFRKPTTTTPAPNSKELILALDEVQDPGNMGTILRTADWFGIKTVVCSNKCADAYGPKAVQATMGALARVRVSYVNMEDWLKKMNEAQVPIYGTFLEGDNIYKTTLTAGGIILMGNEGHGIASALAPMVTQKLFIPSFAEGETSESLNVSTATAVVISEFRRRVSD